MYACFLTPINEARKDIVCIVEYYINNFRHLAHIIVIQLRENLDKAHTRETRDYYYGSWRRLPTFGFQEIPRDTTENCLAYCHALYGKLLKQSLYLQACTGVCAGMYYEFSSFMLN